MAPHFAFVDGRGSAWLPSLSQAPSFSGAAGVPIAMSTADVKVSRWLFMVDDGAVDENGNPHLAATATGTASGVSLGMFWGRISGTTPAPPEADWQLLFGVDDLPSGYVHFTDHWHIVVADPSSGERFHWLTVALSDDATSPKSTGLAIYKYNAAFELQANFPVVVSEDEIPEDDVIGGKSTTGDHFLCEAPNGVMIGIFDMSDGTQPSLRLLLRDTLGQPDLSTEPLGYLDLEPPVDRAISNGSSATYRAGARSPFRLLTHTTLALGKQSAIYRMNIAEDGIIHRAVTLEDRVDSETGMYTSWVMASEDELPSGRAMAARLHSAAALDELGVGGVADEGAIVVSLYYGGAKMDAKTITEFGNRPHVLCVGSRVYVAYDSDSAGECYLWWDDVDAASQPAFAEGFPVIRP